ncbi:nuclease-related domain-containing protein [Bacillus sp. EB01]|uniref:nuclease-related domain-containing protein n=1 Tax=Bacillus sp. EB01 TaxID=1347086 RepID=UPI0005C5C742|nr:nuclease-related domain-containing protein [Bacillus sp. EB01]
MLYKARTKSEELLTLECLDKRMTLPEQDQRRLYRLKKGFEGETQFDNFTSELQSQCIVLNDLNFKVNNTTIQVDTTIIFGKTLKFYEVKNFEGDYYLNEEKFLMRDGTEKNNPLLQLMRIESSYRQLLKELNCNLPIDASVVFVNPAFMMYNAPLNQPIIYPSQLTRLQDQLNKLPSSITPYHWSVADKLKSLHQEKNEFTKLPDYKYDNLKKGSTCAACDSFDIIVAGHKLICLRCGHEEDVPGSIMRNVKEVQLLFPDIKISTPLINNWCHVIPENRIKRVLEKNYTLIWNSRWSYYK